MSETLYIRPDKNWALFGTVSDGSPSDGDPDHELSWLVDGRPGFPLRLTGGTAQIVITNPLGAVNLVAICHHLLTAGLSVGITGDVVGTIQIPAYPVNGVPFNAWDTVSPGSPQGSPEGVDRLTITITGNTGDIVIGELVAGDALALDPSLRIDTAAFGLRSFVNGVQNPLSGIPPYSDRAEARTIRGSQYYPQATLDAILEWYRAQDAYPYPVPSLLIVDSDDATDARLVTFASEPRWTRVGPEGSDVEFLVEVDFLEYPRTRW